MQDGSTPVDPQLQDRQSPACRRQSQHPQQTTRQQVQVVRRVLCGHQNRRYKQGINWVIGKADGTGFVFDTGSLTGIDLNDYDNSHNRHPGQHQFYAAPGWTGTNVTNTNNTTPYWIFDAAANITTTSGATWWDSCRRRSRDMLTELFVVQDAATVANFRVQNTGNAQSAVYLASPTTGSMVQNSNNIFSGTPTIAKPPKRRYQIYNHRYCGVRK